MLSWLKRLIDPQAHLKNVLVEEFERKHARNRERRDISKIFFRAFDNFGLEKNKYGIINYTIHGTCDDIHATVVYMDKTQKLVDFQQLYDDFYPSKKQVEALVEELVEELKGENND